MNLMFAIDHKCAAPLLSCLKSIARNGGAERYDTYVLHSDLDKETRTAIESMTPDPVSIHFVQVDPGMFAGFPLFKRYPVQIYFRIAAPRLLPESVDRILYLDADTLVINSLGNLYNSDFGDNLIMACSHSPELLTLANDARLGVKNDTYFNTGVMMMNMEELRKELDMEAIKAYVEERAPFLLLPDQDIMNVLYGDRVIILDSMIYNLSDRLLTANNANPLKESRDLEWIRENSVIIHYYGPNKPWKGRYLGILDVFYKEYKVDFPGN